MRAMTMLGFGLIWVIGGASVSAKTPGEFRPRAVAQPAEKVGASGMKVQPPETLPRSRAPIATARRKPKLTRPGQPTLRGDDELVLNAGWELIEAPRVRADGRLLSKPGLQTGEWYDATVPGTVLTTLVEQGVYPDPYFGLNNLAIPESLNRQDYWYRTEFTLPAGFAGREVWLEFQGINYYAEVWLNGDYLGHIAGAFIRGHFQITRLAKPGATNVLAVLVAPPPNPGLPSEQSDRFGPGDNGGKMCLDGPTYVCSEGWDWIPAIRDRCTGLWQDVVVRATGPVTIADPHVVTDLPLPETARADITVQAELHNATDVIQRGTFQGAFEGVTFEQPVTLQPGETSTVAFRSKEYPQLTVKEPRLWWPNGYGRPELYHLELNFVESGGRKSDHKALRFGIREMTYELGVKRPDGQVRRFEYSPTKARGAGAPVIDVRRVALQWDPPKHEPLTQVALGAGAEKSPALKPVDDDGMGPYLVVKVNGRRILCLGGNWGMDDALKRVSRARLEPYVRMHRDAHLTMIRNWAGQSTSEVFYELCDEYGILVWNDFWLNTEGWNYNPADHDLFLKNAADTLKRFRCHPSVALWCARNEGVPPEPLNLGLDRLIRELDGTRYYQPNSRLVNLRPSGPWSNAPLERYFRELNQGFSTEMGAGSIPSAEVMRTMMAAEDLWPPGDAWAYHDFHSRGAGDRGSILGAMSRRYGEAKDLEDLCRKAQMVNYETYRAVYEGFNSRLWNSCSGVLVWMSHPSWPSVVWQFYTWDYEANASLFGARKGAEPVHIQMNLPDCKVVVINRSAKPLADVTAEAALYDLTGRSIQNRSVRLTAAADSCSAALRLDWPADGAYLGALTLRDSDGKVLSENLYWHARNEAQLKALNTLPKVTLQGSLRRERVAGGDHLTGVVSNTSSAPALAVKLTLREARTGRRILPAYFEDNYFSLLPGQSRGFRVEFPMMTEDLQVDLDGWNIQPTSLR